MARCPALADDVQDAAKLLKAGQHQQALDRVNKVLAAKPKDAQARFLKGLILTEQGNTKDAIEIFTQLTKDYPELPEPYNNLAVIYASQGQYDKARAALEQSIRTHPSYATAYENLGDVYAKLASQAYDKALQIDSSNTAAKNKLSLVRELVGRPSATVVAAAPKEPAKEQLRKSKNPKPAPEKPAAAPAPGRRPLGRGAENGKRLGRGVVQEGRRCLPRLLRQGLQDARQGEPRRMGEDPARAHHRAQVDLGERRLAQGDHERRRSATVTFRQNYKSDVLKSNSQKTLVLVKSDGGWKIVEEKSG